jgi:hypothetical protein
MLYYIQNEIHPVLGAKPCLYYLCIHHQRNEVVANKKHGKQGQLHRTE